MRKENRKRLSPLLAILTLREDVASIYTQKKLDELDEELGIQDWNNFVKEIKTMFSDKMKTADAE